MAHGQNAKKYSKAGKEWWGARPLSCTSVARKKGMKFWKRLLHKIERRQGKDDISNQHKNHHSCK